MSKEAVNSYGVVTKEFSTSYENAFLFISDPKNLPKWTVLFQEASDSHAVLDTPQGPIKFGMVTSASFERGVIDWYILSDNGKQVDKSYSRLHRLQNGHCVYSFMFIVAPMPHETSDEALNRQTNLIEEELGRLKRLFETN